MSNLEDLIQDYLDTKVIPALQSSVAGAIHQILSAQDAAPSKNGDQYLTAKEAAAYIGDQLSTFYKRMHRNEIPRHGPPGRIYCKRSDLDAFISQKHTKSVQQIQAEAETALLSKPKRRGRRKAA